MGFRRQVTATSKNDIPSDGVYMMVVENAYNMLLHNLGSFSFI